MLPKHSQKTFSVYKFPSKHVSVWCQKKYLHCTISWRATATFLKHFGRKCLYISVYLPKKTFAWKGWVIRFHLVVWGLVADWIIFLSSLLGFRNFFYFNWHFSKFSYFSVFRYFHQYWNAGIFQIIWTSKVRLWQSFS